MAESQSQFFNVDQEMAWYREINVDVFSQNRKLRRKWETRVAAIKAKKSEFVPKDDPRSRNTGKPSNI